jgi:hypothetical protein
MKIVNRASSVSSGGERGGDQHPQFAVQAEYAYIEQLVMQGAKGEAVIEGVWPVECEPANVGRFHSDGGSGELAVVAAECALPIPRLQHSGTPARIAQPLNSHLAWAWEHLGNSEDPRRVKTHGFEHVRCNGFWEVTHR